MKIWIRSQDKKHVLLTDDISVVSPRQICNDNYVIQCNHMNFGKFKTEQQAMDVFEEIVKLIQPKLIVKFNGLLSPEQLKLHQEHNDNIVIDESFDIQQLSTEKFYQIPGEN